MCILQRVLVPFLALLASTGCSSPPTKPGDEQEKPQTVTSLARSFTIHESRRGSGTTQAVEDVKVDYDSEIVVKPDRAALARIGAVNSTPVAASSTDLQRELGLTLEEIEAYTRAASLAADSERAPGVAIADDPTWAESARRELALVRRMQRLTIAIVSEKYSFADSRWADGTSPGVEASSEKYEKAGEELGALQGRLGRVVNGELFVDSAALSIEINEAMELQRRKLDALEKAAEEKAVEYDLSVTAELLRGQEPYPVSVAPYSLVEGQTRGGKSRRVSLPAGPDLERLEAEYPVVEEFARSINRTLELVRDQAKFAAALKELGASLDAYAKKAKERLDAKIAEAVDAPQPEVGEVRKAAKDAQAAIEKLSEEVRTLVAGASQMRSPAVLRAASNIENLVRDELGKALEELKAKIKAVDLTPLPPFVPALEALVVDELEEIAEAVKGTAFGASLGGLIGSVRNMQVLANSQGFGALKPGNVTRKPFAIDKAPDGVIQLANSPAEADDVLRITYELAPKAAADGKDVTVWRESTLLDIRKFGFYTTYGSQVLFADRIGDGSSRYQAAAGLAVNLHYRPETARTFFDVVAPGIGICVAAPSFENGVELAVGLQATVFNDTIQAGYLYDISVEDDPWAFYFGLDLIQAFRKLN